MANWYVIRGDQERGPFDDAQLKSLATSGKLKADHFIRRDGSDTARPAKNIKGLFLTHRPNQIDQKQIPPPLPESKATTKKPPFEKGNSPPPLPPSNLGKNIGAFCGIIVLLMGGIRGCLQVTTGKPKQAATVTSENRGQAKKPNIAAPTVTPQPEHPPSANSIFDATGNRRGGFVDSNGRVIIEYRFDFPSEFSDGLAPMKSQGKWGYIDKTGQFVIKPIYDISDKGYNAGHFSGGFVGVEVNDRFFCIDKSGKVLFESKYRVGPFSDGVFHLVAWLPPLPDGDQRMPRVCTGFCDMEGNVIVTPRPCVLTAFTDGRAVMSIDQGRNSTSAIIDKTGNYLIGPSPMSIGFGVPLRGISSFNSCGFWEGLVTYKDETSRLSGYLDLNGNQVIPASTCQAQNASPFSEGLARIQRGMNIQAVIGGAPIPRDNTLYGYIDKRGNNVIPCKYANGSNFSEGYAAVQNVENKKWGYIDKIGDTVIPFKYDKGRDFVEGRAAVQLVKDGKWGYIDKKGDTVAELMFDEAEFFANGVAIAKKGELYGLIDANGKFVVEPRFKHIGEFVGGIAWFEWP